MINHFLTNYLRAKVLIEEMNCYGYRKGQYKIKLIKIVNRYYQ